MVRKCKKAARGVSESERHLLQLRLSRLAWKHGKGRQEADRDADQSELGGKSESAPLGSRSLPQRIFFWVFLDKKTGFKGQILRVRINEIKGREWDHGRHLLWRHGAGRRHMAPALDGSRWTRRNVLLAVATRPLFCSS